MNVAIFGGTFDPVHLGHLAVARTAQQEFHLGRIYFVPADVPPHKRHVALAPFEHRYAMLALATAGEARWVPSLMEAPRGGKQGASAAHGVSYSIDTVRRFQRLHPRDRLFFLIGIDAFLDIATWRAPEQLLREAEFIVASRPGFSLADVGGALPASLRPGYDVLHAMRGRKAQGKIVLKSATLHLMGGVKSPVSATAIRPAAAAGRSLARFVPREVGDYMRKMHLYKPGRVPAPVPTEER